MYLDCITCCIVQYITPYYVILYHIMFLYIIDYIMHRILSCHIIYRVISPDIKAHIYDDALILRNDIIVKVITWSRRFLVGYALHNKSGAVFPFLP